jgi:hypothetical protein
MLYLCLVEIGVALISTYTFYILAISHFFINKTFWCLVRFCVPNFTGNSRVVHPLLQAVRSHIFHTYDRSSDLQAGRPLVELSATSMNNHDADYRPEIAEQTHQWSDFEFGKYPITIAGRPFSRIFLRTNRALVCEVRPLRRF